MARLVMRTWPTQAASKAWVNRAQRVLKECLKLIAKDGAGCEACRRVKARLVSLDRSADRAQRR